ncbi:hydroxypyruvate isomerase family protein [Halopseudomonas salegens]|uniref:Hydroxypyruvate isomerase n=1 Tax=Halopseudomonas salegens TaxID=1434072 RepID=A0A1H2FZQ3_9GAMM|nr:TIM barrel protein [Halopseudomonas salegens]SDU12710.1 hydroxypyruvate isomerase [Halopseudomonas salegens]
MAWPLAANLSMLFTEAELVERAGLARHAGFAGVEIQFPYSLPATDLQQVLQHNRLPLVLINLPAADLLQGGPGLAAVPGREADFARALEQALRYAEVARPLQVNVLPGRLADGVDREQALELLGKHLRAAGNAFADLGIGVVCEAINSHDMPGFLLDGSDALLLMLQRVGHTNVRAQIDLYHLARMQEDIGLALNRLQGFIGHIQFADYPGRHEPGTGAMDYSALAGLLQAVDYEGWLAAEYQPAGLTAEGLAWMDVWRQSGLTAV